MLFQRLSVADHEGRHASFLRKYFDQGNRPSKKEAADGILGPMH
jgi:hypothetical protein